MYYNQINSVMEIFGDNLFDSIGAARNKIFLQGELTQLTYQAYDMYVRAIEESQDEIIKAIIPLGLHPNNELMIGNKQYTKQELIEYYQYAHDTQLPTNGMYQLVTIMEVLLGDILRLILMKFPNKIPNKRKCDYEIILNAESIDQLKLALANIVLNELNYKSPKEFAEEFKNYTGVDLMISPFYHSFLELKATRDIHIHNNGISNNIYLTKSGAKARVAKSGEYLPVDMLYYFQNYEACLQITEYLERELHNIWESPKYIEQRKLSQPEENQQQIAIEKAIEIVEKQKESLDVKISNNTNIIAIEDLIIGETNVNGNKLDNTVQSWDNNHNANSNKIEIPPSKLKKVVRGQKRR